MFNKNVIVIRRENGLVLAEYPVSSMHLEVGGSNDGKDLKIVARLKDSLPELKPAETPKMKDEEIQRWLEENCQGISIMWRMRYSGVVKPRDEHRLICYNIQQDKEKVMDDA